MKAMCFLISKDKKSCSFLFGKLKDRDNVGRYEYPFTVTSSLVLLIRTEGIIRENQQSTNEIATSERGVTQKDAWGTYFPRNVR